MRRRLLTGRLKASPKESLTSEEGSEVTGWLNGHPIERWRRVDGRESTDWLK